MVRQIITVLSVVECFLSSCTYIFFFFKQKTAYEMRISDWSSDVCSSDLLTAKTPGLIIGQPTIDLAAATHALFTARFQWAIASDDNSPGQALKRDSIKTIHWYLGRDALKVMVATTYSGLIGPLIFPRSELSCLNGAVDAYFESLTSRAVSHSTEEDLLRESGAARR